MTAIDAKEAAAILHVKESWVRDRVKPGTPKAKQVPHYRMPGSKLVRFHREVVESWRDAGCPSWDSWEPAPPRPELVKKSATR